MGTGAGRISLTLTYADGVSAQRTATLPTAQNHDLLLFASAEELFRKVCQRRVRIKGLKLVCSRFNSATHQLCLFADPDAVSPRQSALQAALDRLRSKHGMSAIRWGRSFMP